MRSLSKVKKNRFNQYGLKYGYWETYYSNGNLCSKGSYNNGEKVGIWKEYHYTNGQLNSKGLYRDTKKKGYWEYYFSSGNLCSKGEYLNGEREGRWRHYDNSGNLIRNDLYRQDKIVPY
jgi:antitoxin component YwqK of YwqJK toxin-antitoxin module